MTYTLLVVAALLYCLVAFMCAVILFTSSCDPRDPAHGARGTLRASLRAPLTLLVILLLDARHYLTCRRYRGTSPTKEDTK